MDELLETLLPRAAPADLRTLAGPLLLTATDAARSWPVSPQWMVADGAAGAAARVRAPAAVLLLWAWRRPSTVEPEVDGDGEVARAFRRSRFVP